MKGKRKKMKERSKRTKRNIGRHYQMIKQSSFKISKLVSQVKVRELEKCLIVHFKMIILNQVILILNLMGNINKKLNQLQRVMVVQMRLLNRILKKAIMEDLIRIIYILLDQLTILQKNNNNLINQLNYKLKQMMHQNNLKTPRKLLIK